MYHLDILTTIHRVRRTSTLNSHKHTLRSQHGKTALKSIVNLSLCMCANDQHLIFRCVFFCIFTLCLRFDIYHLINIWLLFSLWTFSFILQCNTWNNQSEDIKRYMNLQRREKDSEAVVHTHTLHNIFNRINSIIIIIDVAFISWLIVETITKKKRVYYCDAQTIKHISRMSNRATRRKKSENTKFI